MAEQSLAGSTTHRTAPEQEHPHACGGSGIVWIGRMVLDEAIGEEVEVIEAISCRRCVARREVARAKS